MFEIGQEIEVIGETYTPSEGGRKGQKGIIEALHDKNYSWNGHCGPLWRLNISGCTRYCYEQDIKLINKKFKNMNIIERFKLFGLGEPEKSFRILGIQNDKGELTSDGKALYDAWKFEQDKKAFNEAVVAPLMAELEKEKENCK